MGGRAVTRRRIALLLTALVATSGVLPLLLLAVFGLQILRDRGERASQEALEAIAAQAGTRIATYIVQQREMLRAIGTAVADEADAARRLADVSLDAPSLGKLRLVSTETSPRELPRMLNREQIAAALRGNEVASETYIAELSPAMDVCVPSGKLGRAVCATLDLLELQRQVQRIRIGEQGYALAFDRTGRLVAAGSGAMRAAVLSGEPVAESALASGLVNGTPAPTRLRSGDGRDVLAGWTSLPNLGWSIAVEQPAEEALRGARTALKFLASGAVLTLLISIAVGSAFARRMLTSLELEERFKTAGRIATGVTHDLGHRLTILQQIEQLAAMNDADYLPRIRESLAGEVSTLRRFVADFSDLTREAKPADFLPIELNAFAESVRLGAQGYAKEANVTIELQPAPSKLWVRGDRYLLERAALNLTRNAIEASKPGSAVRLRIERGNGAAVLAVEDRGQGVEPDRIATLFESFSSTKRTGAHVGMGLPNVRRIAVAHGGTVSVKSKPGEGSTFTLSLPVSGDQSSSPLAPATMP
ncbi:MAG: sensor histidine kinase [Deltaproteobacteria bacterium]|nr:MAG: sensor histidine kinase [Deltaproteobacteria bacterium]